MDGFNFALHVCLYSGRLITLLLETARVVFNVVSYICSHEYSTIYMYN